MRPLLTLLLLIPICVQSQPPFPGPTESGGNEQAKAIPKQDELTGDQRISQALATAIDRLAADVEAKAKQSSTAPHDDEASSARWAKASSAISALATVLIAFLGYRQWRTMQDQAKHMREGLAETRRAANAAKESVDLAHATFLSAHRPRLEIRNIQSTNTTLPALPSAGVFRLVNSGETEATISGYLFEMFVGPRLPRIPPYEGKHPTTIKEIVKPGGFLEVRFPSIPVDYVQSGHYAGLENHRERAKHERVVSTLIDPLFIFLVGFVNYSDRSDNARRKGVCFKYDFRFSRFEQEADPDYDYGS